jgi:hypothetical protein
MRITESQLRKIVREEAQSLMSEGLTPGKIESPEEFKQLIPGDRITVNGKPAVVIEYDSFGAGLSYAWEGTSTRRNMDARLAWSYEPGEIPETNVVFIGPGEPIKAPRRAPMRRSSHSYYD